MALKTFTATRAADVPGRSNQLRSWSVSQGTGAQTIRFCDGTTATPLFEVQLPATSSASQSYSNPYPVFPNGLAVEVVGTGFNRGCIDIV